MFPSEFLRQLHRFYACGNYGDPIAARDTLAVFARARDSNAALELGLYTNGSGRDPAWWAELARLGCTVRFAIDGLRDTNHLYRRGTDWDTVMRSAQAFVAAGGRAEWAFIVFRHNEHQIAAAAALSREMGFTRFLPRRTDRFTDTSDGMIAPPLPVLGTGGNVEYHLEPPQNPAYRPPAGSPAAGGDAVDRLTHLMTTPITCRAVAQRTLYVTAEGLVFPCCWLGSLYPRQAPADRPQLWRLIDSLPEGRRIAQRAAPRPAGRHRGPVLPAADPRALAPDVRAERRRQPGAASRLPRVCGRRAAGRDGVDGGADGRSAVERHEPAAAAAHDRTEMPTAMS